MSRSLMAPALRHLRLFPLGHSVDFFSEHSELLNAAQRLWGDWPQLFDQPSLKFTLEMSGVPDISLPSYQLMGGTLVLSSASAAAAFSSRLGYGCLRVSEPSLLDGAWFRYHWLQPLVLTALDMVFFEPLHAACISQEGRGILLCGDSGAGKTTLAYACGKAGWTLLSEDGVRLAPLERGQLLVGTHWTYNLRPGTENLFPELGALPVSVTSAGKHAILVDAPSLGIPVGRTGCPHHTVFLSRGSGPARMTPYPIENAAQYFLQTSRNPNRAASKGKLEQMLKAGCSLLQYDHPSDAVTLLERLL